MTTALKTTVTDLPESRVRVEAEVPPEEVERRMEQTARQLGKDLRMPGFRKGKVPPPVVIQRVGRDAVVDEAVRGSLGRWYVDAIDAAGIHPVGDPDVDLGDLPQEGQPLTFTIEIGVRPQAPPRGGPQPLPFTMELGGPPRPRRGDYRGAGAPRREPLADDEAVDA